MCCSVLLITDITHHAMSNSTALIGIHRIPLFCLCLFDTCVVLGNGMVMAAILTTRSLQRPTYYFILSLAVSDVAIGSIVVPLFVYLHWRGPVDHNDPICRAWLISHTFLTSLSVYNLLGIGVDRMWALTRPLMYKARMTAAKARTVIGIVWLMAVVITVLSFLPIWSEMEGYGGDECSLRTPNREYAIFSTCMGFYIPALTLTLTYLSIYRSTRRVGLNQRNGQLDVTSDASGCSRDATGQYEPSVRYTGPDTTIQTAVGENDAKIEILPAALMRPRTRSPNHLRIHKGPYRKRSRSSPFRNGSVNLQLEPENVQMACLSRRLQSEPAGAMAILLSPRRSISDCALRLGSRIRWSGHSTSSAGSVQSDPTPHTRRSYAKMEHDFWFRLALRSRRFSSRFSDVISTKYGLVGRYQRRIVFELKAVRTFALVTVCFSICWSGLCVVNTYQIVSTKRIPDWIWALATMIGYLHGAFNPVIYGISNRNIRTAFHGMLRSVVTVFTATNNSQQQTSDNLK